MFVMNMPTIKVEVLHQAVNFCIDEDNFLDHKHDDDVLNPKSIVSPGGMGPPGQSKAQLRRSSRLMRAAL